MSLVGDVILTCREQMPDIPQVVGSPATPVLTPSTSGGALPTCTLYVVCTYVNAWGETTASVESSTPVTGNTGSVQVAYGGLPGLTAKIYYSTSAGAENVYIPASGGIATVTVLTPGNYGTPPSFNSCFVPDSDGSSVGAYTIFRWLNDAIQEMSRMAGGILDMTGVQASTVAADYVIPQTPAPWIRFTDAWFDGYFCQDFKRRNQWRRQFISAISFYWSVEQVNRQMILNFYPVPNRNGATGTLASPMTSTSNVIPMTSIPAGMMTPGMCQIDNETIIYSTTSGNNLTGAIRGMAGTTAAAHSGGATVTEFNLVLAGFRQPVTYTVGQSAQTLMIPTGWEMPIVNFVLSRYRNYEQNRQEAGDLYKAFVEEAKRIAFDSRQFPASAAIGGPASFLTLYPGGPFGVIVP